MYWSELDLLELKLKLISLHGQAIGSNIIHLKGVNPNSTYYLSRLLGYLNRVMHVVHLGSLSGGLNSSGTV